MTLGTGLKKGHFKIIVEFMGNHFQKLKRSEREQNILLEQLRNYKLRNSSYNPPFSFESGNKELKYVGQNISDEELKNLISNAKLWLDDEEIIDLNNSIFTDGN
nr:15040_t:CDS:2 [Entrophospora candida]